MPVDKDAVHDDHGVIDEHAHGYDEGAERYAVERGAAEQEDGEGDGYRQDQAEADDQAAAEAHGEDQHEDDYGDALDQVPHERGDGFVHLVGLEEDFLRLESGRHVLHDFRQAGVHGFSHVGDDGVLLKGDADGQGGLAADEEAVALRLGVGALYAGHVAQAQGFAVERLDEEVAQPVDVRHGGVHVDGKPLAAGRGIARVDHLAGGLQRGDYLRGHDAVARNLFLRERDVDRLVAVAGDEDALHALYVLQLAAQVLGVAVHFRIVVALGRERVEYAVHVRHVVDDHRLVAALRQPGGGVADLAAQQVEVLFQVAVAYGHEKLHGERGRAVAALRLHLLDVGQVPQFVFHHLGHLQLHLVGAGPRVGHDDHGLLGRDGRVLQLGHLQESEHAGYEYRRRERPEEQRPADEQLCELCHSRSPTLVRLSPLMIRTFSPS